NKNIKFKNIDIIIIIRYFFLFKKKNTKIKEKIKNEFKKKINKYILKFYFKNNYLNIIFNNFFYINLILNLYKYPKKINNFLFKKKNKKKLIIIEFSSPNLNKPLHIGHLRNILIGNTLSNIYKIIGYKVIKSQIFNDRGLHICKNIIAWKLFYKKKKINKKIKEDHFIGQLYFKYENEFKKEINKLKKKYKKKKEKVIKYSKLYNLITKELIKWENKNYKTLKIWNKIKRMTIRGIKKTYRQLNIKFDETLYESNIYKIGKQIVYKGLKKKIFILDKKKFIFYLYKKKKKSY
ncbi:MAG: arginine--tRNA ligase, partial [Candidatus Shikimatogenerans sp. JK-2022]|nr:arginine--tRNA ligase [Candidatus Shikimatogenerans bostrichidophilus]